MNQNLFHLINLKPIENDQDKRYLILDEVADDLDDGKVFYNNIETGLGDYFWDCLISDIESLFLFAGIHIKKSGYYRMMSKRFPYAIYDEIHNDIAQIIAILPMRHTPAWIMKELETRNL